MLQLLTFSKNYEYVLHGDCIPSTSISVHRILAFFWHDLVILSWYQTDATILVQFVILRNSELCRSMT